MRRLEEDFNSSRRASQDACQCCGADGSITREGATDTSRGPTEQVANIRQQLEYDGAANDVIQAELGAASQRAAGVAPRWFDIEVSRQAVHCLLHT
jgi:hypothetical protein